MTNSPSRRIWQLDALRGVAILLMVAFHVVFDLKNFFDFENLDYHQGFWYYEGRLSAILFIGLAGAVSALVAPQKNLYRGIRLILVALPITIATWIAFPEWAIWFGILHFLGAALLLSATFASLKAWNALLGIGAIGLGMLLQSWRVESWAWLALGLRPYGFQTLDYYPLFPWLGVLLIGIAAGPWLKRQFNPRAPCGRERALIWLGKYSLWIYLGHQPVLLALLWLWFKGI